ncbi:tRNA 2-selenouridine(34) synthase MnmH [Siminovitchia sp. 179-K 8D1 HS]|uniref:tRNA 2-selenouridine(34) synthase MnmH n=1 Tax=Siminovitchia sp. 179-K 8D1 HS TaxID=3142385 RepID=UPI00399EEAD4
MFNDIALTDLLALRKTEKHTIVDVRSPGEFNEATIPGSINIPVFNDAERAEVGTIYKHFGKEAAMERGVAIFSQKLPSFISAFKQIDTPLTVFCWRGGMRSKTAATMLDLMGIHANRLLGGIRSYRKWVVQKLAEAKFPPKLIVLNGYTGTGKTAILRELSQMGFPVMDLEKMAGHRGSIFGHIGLNPSNQKKFDSLLVETMVDFWEEPYVLIEGESRRIGKASLPEFLYEKKEQGLHLFIRLPIKERIKHILEDYRPWQSPERFQEAFRFIKKRIHTPIAKEIEAAIENGRFASAAELLLTYYYDPRYEHSTQVHKNKDTILIEAGNKDEALKKIAETLLKEWKVQKK